MTNLLLASALALGDLLTVGSPAPALSVEKFLKGDEVKSFEPGKVYVLEFWATWCGPCISAMPHLSQLQRDNPGITVIGVAGFERQKDAAGMEQKVREFLDGRGKDAGISIALDTDGSMAQTWMNAARRRTIPTSMVVGADGKIAYVGSPNSELDAAVAQALGNPAAEAGKKPATPKPTSGQWRRGEQQDPSQKQDPAKKKEKGGGTGSGAPAEALEPGTTEEVTTEATDDTGESTTETTSTSTSSISVNGVAVTQTVTETVRVEVRNGTKTTTKRRTVTRSDAQKP
jgi:thiol-disulfide isomerase/thioredoxin